MRGPGETQLEVDRREISRKIAYLREELEKVRAHRSRYRERRKQAEIPTIALVGYTNAGKSTLLNRVAEAEVYVANQLFATLDPTTRRIELPSGREVLLTDTVGFIQKLPTTLVAAFRATLEEINEADLLVHIIDITHPNARAQAQAVESTLKEIGGGDLTVVTALNKIDRLRNPEAVYTVVDEFDRAVPISARTGEGVAALLSAVENELYESMLSIRVAIPYQDGRLISLFHEHGLVSQVEHRREHVEMAGRIPNRIYPTFSPYLIGRSAGGAEDGRVEGQGEIDPKADAVD